MTPAEKLAELTLAVEDARQASNDTYARQQELVAELQVVRDRHAVAWEIRQRAVERLIHFEETIGIK